MIKKNLGHNIINGTKWSILAELISKIIVPITNMILARLLAPEIFGIIATISIVISFAQMLSDAGFQKYIIFKEFSSEDSKQKHFSVAFLVNLILSLLLWIIIFVNKESFASLLGNSTLGLALAVAAFQIPLYSISSIQLAIFRRDFKFKTYFYIRIVSSLVPIFVSIPLAYFGYGYWSIIWGTSAGLLVATVLYLSFSSWKPKLFFSFQILRNMLAYATWNLLDSLSIWLTSWVDSLLIIYFISSDYYLGLYKNSVLSITGVLNIIVAAFTPVLFSGLSRLQNDENSFYNLYLNAQKSLAFVIIPFGILSFFYRDLLTLILLGEQWMEGAYILGLWGLVSVFVILLSSLNSEVFRAKGKPKLSLLVQVVHLVFLVPIIIYGLEKGFWYFVNYRTLIRLQIVVVSLITMKIAFGYKIKKVLYNIAKPILCSIPILIVSVLAQEYLHDTYYKLFSILFALILYIITLLIFSKKEIDFFIMKFFKKQIGKET